MLDRHLAFRGSCNGQLGLASGALLWIVDRANLDWLIPLKAPGELLIGGPLVGREYLQDEQDKAILIVVVRLW